MRQRGIEIDDVKDALLSCSVIEEYPEDRPLRSFLVLGYSSKKDALHIVVALDNEENMLWVITVYKPSAVEWNEGFARRIRK